MKQYAVDIRIAVDASTMLAISGNKSLGVYTATETTNYPLAPFVPWQALNQIQPDLMGGEANYRENKLRAEIAALKRELAAVKQEKAHLEILLETITEPPKSQFYQMQIEIDQNKRSHQVAAITQSDYFQQLLADVELLRASNNLIF